jgi:hypothetical protein
MSDWPVSNETPEEFKARQLERAKHELLKERQVRAALQKLVKYYKRHEPEWDDEFKATDEFLDIREVYDLACEALR